MRVATKRDQPWHALLKIRCLKQEEYSLGLWTVASTADEYCLNLVLTMPRRVDNVIEQTNRSGSIICRCLTIHPHISHR